MVLPMLTTFGINIASPMCATIFTDNALSVEQRSGSSVSRPTHGEPCKLSGLSRRKKFGVGDASLDRDIPDMLKKLPRWRKICNDDKAANIVRPRAADRNSDQVTLFKVTLLPTTEGSDVADAGSRRATENANRIKIECGRCLRNMSDPM